MRFAVLCIGVSVFALAGCGGVKKATVITNEPTNHLVQAESEYVALEYPISLPPFIASGLSIDESKKNLGFNRNLLGLPSSASKVQTRQIKGEGSINSGVVNVSTSAQRLRTSLDVLTYASYPLPVEVPYDEPVGCLSSAKSKSNCKTTAINIIPLIGAGVRVVADYESENGSADAALAYLSGKTSGSQLKGTLQLQLLGISRFGSSATSFSQLNLSPESVSMMQQQVSSIMSQLWYKDTVIQPQIVGYTIVGGPDPKLVSVADIMDRLLANVHFLADNFFEALLAESLKRGDVLATDCDTLRSKFHSTVAANRLYSVHSPVAEFIRQRADASLSRPDTMVDDPSTRIRIMDTVLKTYINKGPADLQTDEMDRLITYEILGSLVNDRMEKGLRAGKKDLDQRKKDAVKSEVMKHYKAKKLEELKSSDIEKSIEAQIVNVMRGTDAGVAVAPAGHPKPQTIAQEAVQ